MFAVFTDYTKGTNFKEQKERKKTMEGINFYKGK
jgi:hypothetical protein